MRSDTGRHRVCVEPTPGGAGRGGARGSSDENPNFLAGRQTVR
jgi:hypothetical protein